MKTAIGIKKLNYMYITKISDDNINSTIFDKVVYQKLNSKPAKKALLP